MTIALPVIASDNVSLNMYGPEVFSRSSGIFYTRTFELPSTQGEIYLHVVNGDGAGNNDVNSATILVNAIPVINPLNLNQSVRSVDKKLSLLKEGTNYLVIMLGPLSSSSSYITLRITGDYRLDIKINFPATGTVITAGQTTVSGNYVSYTSNIGISVNGIAASFSDNSFSVSGIPLSSGSNTLTATITTGDGLQDNDSIVVSTDYPPVAEAGRDRHVRVGQREFLDGRNSYDPEGIPISYSWSLLSVPAGSVAALEDNSFVFPSLVPDLPGNYVTSLIVHDGNSAGVPDNVTLIASYPNVQPAADAGRDQSVLTVSRVTLDGTRSSDPDNDPLSYAWQIVSLPTGSQAVLSDPSSSAPSFTADVSGEYLANLTVHDGQQGSLSDTVLVTAAASNPPPVANAGSDNTVSWRTEIHLDGSRSYDPAGEPLSYRWTIVSKPEGSVSVLNQDSTAAPSILADREGYYVFRLWVSDGTHYSAPDTVVVASVNDPPVANAGADQTVARNTSLTLDGSGSSDANGDALTYRWSILSAPSGSSAMIGNPAAVQPVFTPDLAGAYIVRLIVNDGRSDSAPDNVTITATPLSYTVPSVTGLLQSLIQAILSGAGFTTGSVTTAYSDTVPAGSVISQDPPAGSLAYEGSAVNVVVSLGPQTIAVPDVSGMTQAAATTALTSAGLPLGTITEENSATVPVGNVIRQDPAAGSVVPPGTAVSLVVSLGGSSVAVPSLVGKPQASAVTTIVTAGFTVGTVTTGYSDTVIAGGVMSQSPAAGTSASQGSPISLVISSGPAPVTLPPDPATVAPPVDPTVAPTVKAATEFLYTGANPIQTGVAPGTIELKRAAVLRGVVIGMDNTPLPGVKVAVPDHPEFGQTLTRGDGHFDMAVNGGGKLTVDFKKGGYLPSQRQVNVPWQDYVVLPEVVLVSFDPQVTEVDLSSPLPVQVARGSVVSDADGTRQATLLFFQGSRPLWCCRTEPHGRSRP
jgi:beta-lactam-binding protein with PASTA domain